MLVARVTATPVSRFAGELEAMVVSGMTVECRRKKRLTGSAESVTEFIPLNSNGAPATACQSVGVPSVSAASSTKPASAAGQRSSTVSAEGRRISNSGAAVTGIIASGQAASVAGCPKRRPGREGRRVMVSPASQRG